MLRLCVAGAAGRMGVAIIQEARAKGIMTVGATEAQVESMATLGNPTVGKTLRQLGISDQDTVVQSSDNLADALTEADIFISFTTPEADIVNIPIAANMGKRIILGTTGFTQDQNRQVTSAMSGKVPAVFSPNYSVGVNILFKLAEALGAFPAGYDFCLSEIHHTGKRDAPSGTAKKLEQIIAQARGYTRTIHSRDGASSRQPDELESVAMRAGGVAGIHDIIVAGPNEMLRIEHTAFSRSVFAQGAVYAAEWLNRQTEPKVYSMADVLGLN
jgi:4-hydroxy-tetrahydrodipicolinate reductase